MRNSLIVNRLRDSGKMLFIVSMLAFVVFSSSCSKKRYVDSCYKKVGYFAKRNPEKLVKKLTKGKNDDSAKLAAIYCWVTSNIRYDYDAYASGIAYDGNIQKVLRTRRTTCYGYSHLIKHLSDLAGLRVEIVSGYTKNEDVDINDSFFFGDHAWNSAYINGKWYLFDATWDAGYIEYYRMTYWNVFLYLVSLHTVENYEYKPKFIASPGRQYYFQSGDYFIFDHLPENPIWQLTENISSTIDFRNDSSYYFLRDRKDTNTYSENFESQRQMYGLDGDTAMWIEDGFAYYKFNHMHEIGQLTGLAYSGMEFFKQAAGRSTDTAEMLLLADSLDAYATQMYRHLDSLEKYILLEESQKLANMRLKNHILKRDALILNKSSNQIRKSCRKGILFSKTFRRSSVSYLKKEYQSISKLYSDNKYATTKSANKEKSRKDRIQASIDSSTRLIDSVSLKLDSVQMDFHRLMGTVLERIQLSQDFQFEKLYYLRVLKLYRLNNYDDLDFLVRSVKDSLMSQNASHDTDLYTNKRLVYDSLLILNSKILALQSYRFQLGVKQLSLIRRLKASSSVEDRPAIDSLYYNTLSGIKEDYIAFADWLVNENKNNSNIKKANSKLSSTVYKTRRNVNREKRFKANPKTIKGRKKTLKAIHRHYKYITDNYSRRSKSIRGKYMKK